MSANSAKKLSDGIHGPIKIISSSQGAASEKANFGNIRIVGPEAMAAMKAKFEKMHNEVKTKCGITTSSEASTEQQSVNPAPVNPKKVNLTKTHPIGHFRTLDLRSPRRAKKRLAFAQSEIKEVRKKIKYLEESNRELKNKIETIEPLKNEISLTTNEADNSTINMEENPLIPKLLELKASQLGFKTKNNPTVTMSFLDDQCMVSCNGKPRKEMLLCAGKGYLTLNDSVSVLLKKRVKVFTQTNRFVTIIFNEDHIAFEKLQIFFQSNKKMMDFITALGDLFED